MSSQRIRDIHDAAARLFLRQGYGRTQISHIARAAGVSVGTIYHDFAGKEEIMRFLLKCAIQPEFLERDFSGPITADCFDGLEEEILAAFDGAEERFAAHLPEAGVDYHFEDLISDAFDLLAQYAVGCLFLEKNPMDCPALAEAYRTYRGAFFRTLEDYLRALIRRGELRPLEQVELTACLIIELLTWWAMDVRYVTYEPRDIPVEQAKAVCMDNLIAAYRR